MNSMKKILLGGAAAIALATPALAGFTATNEPNARLAGATGALQFDLNNTAPINADGTLVIDDFGLATNELTQGNRFDLCLTNGVFGVLPTNTVAVSSGVLNFQSGGAGSNCVTYEIDNSDIDFSVAGTQITFSNIIVQAGSYTSSDGDDIRITFSEQAGEVNPVVPLFDPTFDGVTSGNPANPFNNFDRTEFLFTFANGTDVTFRPDGDNDFFDAPELDGQDSIDLAAGSFGELFDDTVGIPFTQVADLGDLIFDDQLVIDNSTGADVELATSDVTIEGPFGPGSDEIFLRAGACTATPAAADVDGTVSGNTATFPTLSKTAALPSGLGGTAGVALGGVALNVCQYTDSATLNNTILLAGQYEGTAVNDTSAGTTESFTGDIDEAVYANGKTTRVAYFFGDGGGYSAFLSVVTRSQSPVILLSYDDDGNASSGLLNSLQDGTTQRLYTAAEADAAVGGGILTSETDRTGFWVITTSDATVGPVILNPSNDLGNITAYE